MGLSIFFCAFYGAFVEFFVPNLSYYYYIKVENEAFGVKKKKMKKI